MRRFVIACCAGVLVLGATCLTVVGCTRARSELPTPTVAAVAVTPRPTGSPPQVLTPQPPPATISAATGPTVVRVADASPTSSLPISTATVAAVLPSQPTASVPTPTLPSTGPFDYTVQWYDTLYSIARRFNTTVDDIVALNQLSNANVIQVGQVLKIRGSSQSSTTTSTEYLVQAGDTLYSIARRFNTTVEALQRANGIVNPWLIHVGQKLSISQGSSVSSSTSSNTYVVQAGDTLYSIAARFGKQVWDIIVANNLSDPHWISVGQVLVIPS